MPWACEAHSHIHLAYGARPAPPRPALCRPVSLLSVFGGTTYSFNPFKLTSAEVIASDYNLDAATDDIAVKAW